MSKDRSLFWIYILSTIGDLNYSLLLTASIIYGTQLGGSPSQTGLIGGGYGITYIILPAILGRFGDKIPRKTSMIIALAGQLLSIGYYILFADTIAELILGQIFFGVAYGFYWPGIEAYISEKTHDTAENHQRGMSNFCIAWGLGFMIGPLIAGFVSDIQVRFTFTIALIIYLVALNIVIFGVSKIANESENNKNPDEVADSETEKIEIIPLEQLAHQRTYDKLISLRLLFGMLVYALIVKVVLTYFTDYAVREDLLNWTGSQTGQAIFVFNVGRELYFILNRYVDHRIFKSSFRNISIGFLVYSALLIIISFVDNIIVIDILFFIFGMFIGMVYLASLDLLIVRERKSKGAKAGLFESTIGFGAVLSPIIAGFLAELNPYLPFYFYAALVIFVFGFNIVIKKRIQKESILMEMK